MVGRLYPKRRDAVETVRADWPVVAPALILRAGASVPASYPEIRERRARETGWPHRECPRRRQDDGKASAGTYGWPPRPDVVLSRRRTDLAEQGTLRTVRRHRGNDDIVLVVRDRRRDGWG